MFSKLSAGLISNIFDVSDLGYHDQINIELSKQDSCHAMPAITFLCDFNALGLTIALNECSFLTICAK
jgi:hypothetical protein